MVINLRPWRKVADVYLVWRPDDGETIDDAREVMAFDAEEAAEDWAETDDVSSADYTIIKGSPVKVCVRIRDRKEGEPESVVFMFEVTGETVPQYTAREVGA